MCHLSYDLTYCLIVASETATFFERINYGPVPSKVVKHLLQENGNLASWLGASTISIFGQAYLHRIAFADNGRDTALNLGIQVRPGAILGVNFMLGTHGLRALRLIYGDGLSSAWLGEPSRGAYGTIYGRSLNLLRMFQDDLKVIRLSFDYIEDTRTSIQPAMAIWNIDSRLFDNAVLRIVDTLAVSMRVVFSTRLGQTQRLSQLLHYPNWRLCQYLPLQSGRCYAAGLSVYCDFGGVKGIIAHGKRSRQVDNIQLPGPFLMMTTNQGRSVSFCPWIMNHNRLASWSVVAAGEGRITGLIVDALTVYRSRFQSIGASIYTGVDQPMVLKPRQAPMIFDDVNEFAVCTTYHT
ncbi:hypothetical protein QBC33DRAFT_240607 [Phialemonium atrogriseum]|uniref:Uncharacterized protein n=1 Tax=Phialemonium atrogriseum TaxID=1093897 RepID=A0AAJ0FCF7_9PEZI|nr:uncharacterized protein QBC33DRAFT_240607 [Phialemonium atrogriseum]KAK1763556.1 hypothetical protein QBC33DRAFT_240607 [Phialemonium atrogriseum]